MHRPLILTLVVAKPDFSSTLSKTALWVKLLFDYFSADRGRTSDILLSDSKYGLISGNRTLKYDYYLFPVSTQITKPFFFSENSDYHDLLLTVLWDGVVHTSANVRTTAAKMFEVSVTGRHRRHKENLV